MTMPTPPRAELLAILEACKADPHAAATCLVLADWLEERGDDTDHAPAEFVWPPLPWPNGPVGDEPVGPWDRRRGAGAACRLAGPVAMPGAVARRGRDLGSGRPGTRPLTAHG
jgi:uncharacterized protein (TIGR02996 family)